MTYTPGPWSIESLGIGKYRILAKQGPIDVSPATCWSLPDAHLIASAPDLLAALKKLHEYAHVFVGDMHRQDIEAFISASAAIAKAEGTFS